MKKILVYLLSGAAGLASVGISVATQASAAPMPQAVQISSASMHDSADDVFGVVGDVLVDGCKPAEAPCAKAWQDLGQLAGKDRL
jgi:hypothetical protein